MKITKCSVKNCVKPGKSLFRFPKENETRLVWTKFCENESWWSPNTASRICSNHFEDQFLSVNETNTRLQNSAVPTIKNSNVTNSSDPDIQNLPWILASKPNRSYLITDSQVVELQDKNPLRQSDEFEDYSSGEFLKATVPLEVYNRAVSENILLKEEISMLRKRVKNQQRKIKRGAVIKQKLKPKFLTSYQTKLMYRNQQTGKHWDKETIRKAICTRAACGTRGYNFLRKSGHPLPSIRLLNKKLQSLNFASGILTDFLACLKKILEKMDPLDRRCGIFFDEMSIIPGHEYDPSTNSVLGKSNFPGDPDQDATHGLVFMLCGLRRRWKQIAAYYFTGKYYLKLLQMSFNILKCKIFISIKQNLITRDVSV